MQPEPNYEQLKISYQNFKKNPPKSEFSRWYMDIQLLNSLINAAKKHNLEKDVFELQKQKDVACKKLKEMGYKIKE